MGRLENKVAMIAGGTRGIGFATAKRFVEEGAQVIITGTHQERGLKAVQEIGHNAMFLQHDVSKEEDWAKIYQTILDKFGRLDVLFNNAGIAFFDNPENFELENWQKMMGIDLQGALLGTKYGVKLMKEHGGSIINMCSIEGTIGHKNLFSFSAAKGGVRLLTKSAALYCAEQGYKIRVNTIHPGPIHKAEKDNDPVEQALIQGHLSTLPLGRFGEPYEVANLALFLASDESTYSTGSEFYIDGGYTAQ